MLCYVMLCYVMLCYVKLLPAIFMTSLRCLHILFLDAAAQTNKQTNKQKNKRRNTHNIVTSSAKAFEMSVSESWSRVRLPRALLLVVRTSTSDHGSSLTWSLVSRDCMLCDTFLPFVSYFLLPLVPSGIVQGKCELLW